VVATTTVLEVREEVVHEASLEDAAVDEVMGSVVDGVEVMDRGAAEARVDAVAAGAGEEARIGARSRP
jgi:hypothetical protein